MSALGFKAALGERRVKKAGKNSFRSVNKL